MTVFAWAWRVLLAVLLAVGSEVLLWTNPLGRPVTDWLLQAVIYLLLASVLLDLAVRVNIQNLYGWLALAGVYGLTAALALNPATMLNNLPVTVATLVLGGHTLVGLLAFGLLLSLTAPRPILALIVAALVTGLMAGIWGRLYPVVPEIGYGAVDLATWLAVIGVGIGLSLGLTLLLRALTPDTAQPTDLLLPLPVLAIVGVLLVGAAAVRLTAAGIDTVVIITLVTFLGVCGVILYAVRRRKGQIALAQGLPPHPSWPRLLVLLVVFLVAGVVAFTLAPQIAEVDPLYLVTTLLAAFGLVWLPTLCLVLGMRAFGRLVQGQQL